MHRNALHLVIYLCGTEEVGAKFYNQKDYLDHPSIGIILVKGCEKDEVCGDFYFPNLKKFISRFTKELFSISSAGEKDKKVTTIHLNEVKQFSSIGIDETQSTCKRLKKGTLITGITVAGYSRGGVECFEFAKEFNDKAPNFLIDIVVNQPVPGNMFTFSNTNAASVLDCQHLKNLKYVAIIIAANTGIHYNKYEYNSKKDIEVYSDPKTSTLHRTFFSQIVPKLPIKYNLIVIPRENHWQELTNEPNGAEHMHLEIAKCLNLRSKKLVSDEDVEINRQLAAEKYREKPDYLPALFPTSDKLQPIFGLDTKEVYEHLDPLHPMPKLKSGLDLKSNENLFSWWNQHIQEPFSDDEMDFFKDVKETKLSDVSALKNLYAKLNIWLRGKENRSAPRYFHMEALCGNIHYVLVKKHTITERELALAVRQQMASIHYFFLNWKKQTTSESFFSSFFSTEKIPLSLENAVNQHKEKESDELKNCETLDFALLEKLDEWLHSDNAPKSKYFLIITDLRKNLHDTSIQCYDAKPVVNAKAHLKKTS